MMGAQKVDELVFSICPPRPIKVNKPVTRESTLPAKFNTKKIAGRFAQGWLGKKYEHNEEVLQKTKDSGKYLLGKK